MIPSDFEGVPPAGKALVLKFRLKPPLPHSFCPGSSVTLLRNCFYPEMLQLLKLWGGLRRGRFLVCQLICLYASILYLYSFRASRIFSAWPCGCSGEVNSGQCWGEKRVKLKSSLLVCPHLELQSLRHHLPTPDPTTSYFSKNLSLFLLCFVF